MKRTRGFLRLLPAALCLFLLHGGAVSAAEGFRYDHDPRLCPKVMEDAVIDPSAVYGFSPNPDGSIGNYAVFDWTDPAEVEGHRQNRMEYAESYQTLYTLLGELASEGKSTEEIARAVSAKRNEIRLAAYADDPAELAAVKARNSETYGHEEGPLPDELYQKYGSWEMVMERAFAQNPGTDVCVGLYDDYYEYYVAFGYVEDEHTAAATREYAVAAFSEAAGLTGESDLSAFSDGDKVSAWYRESLAAAIANGVLTGYEDATLRPQSTIRRVEALVILSRCLTELPAEGEPVAFRDVPAWAAKDIDRLSSAGIIEGYGNGALGSEDAITVEQVRILMSRLSAK